MVVYIKMYMGTNIMHRKIKENAIAVLQKKVKLIK